MVTGKSATMHVLLTVIVGMFCYVLRPSEAITRIEYRLKSIEMSLKRIIPNNASMSITISDLHTGERKSVKWHSDGNMQPASLVKLYVAANALERNSDAQITFDTVISYDGYKKAERLIGNLYIKGHGNPMLTIEDFDESISKLKQDGISIIAGDIVVDDGFFERTKTTKYGEGPAYASSAALGANLHTVYIKSDGEGAESVPPSDCIQLVRNSKASEIRKITDVLYEIPAKQSEKMFGLDDPALFMACSLRKRLAQSNVEVRGNSRHGIVPDKAVPLAVIHSMPVEELVKAMNSYSINVLADNLFMVLGADDSRAPGTLQGGIRSMREFIDANGLVKGDGDIRIMDGSGLSPDDRLTTDAIVDLLVFSDKQAWREDFINSLAVPGQEGSLRGLNGLSGMHVKTGQTESSYGLAGYLLKSNGPKLAFALIINVDGADLIRNKTQQLLEAIAQR